jgi:hypothetical protein
MNLAVFRGILLVVILIVGFLSTGCLPMRYVSAHGASGRVVDAATGALLSETRVALTRPDNSFAETHTSKQGYFRIPAQHRLYILCPGHAQLFHVPPAAILSVSKDGYYSSSRRISTGFWAASFDEHKVSAVGQVDLIPYGANR